MPLASLRLKRLARAAPAVLFCYPGHVVCEHADHPLALALLDPLPFSPALGDDFRNKILGAISTAKVACFATPPMPAVLRDSHEHRPLLDSLRPQHAQFVRRATPEKDAASLHRYLREKRLGRKVYTGEEFHIVEHPPTYRFHLLPRVTEDAVGQDHGHYARTGLQEVVTALNEENLRRHFLLHIAFDPSITRLRPSVPEVKLLKHVRIVDRDFCAEGRVRKHEVELALSAAVAFNRGVCAGVAPRHAILQTVEADDVPVAIVIHDHVHPRSLAKIGVNVDSVETSTGVLANLVLHSFQLARQGRLGLRAPYLREETAAYVCKRDYEEPSAAARGIQHLLPGLRVEHFHHHPDDVSRCEELTSLALERCRSDRLVRSALRVSVSAQETIAAKFAGNVRQRAIVELDAFGPVEHIPIDVRLRVLEQIPDALCDALSTLFCVALCGAHEERATALLLVEDLREDEMEELPKRAVAAHGLVAIKVVMAPLERAEERVPRRDAERSSLSRLKIFERLVGCGKVRQLA